MKCGNLSISVFWEWTYIYKKAPRIWASLRGLVGTDSAKIQIIPGNTNFSVRKISKKWIYLTRLVQNTLKSRQLWHFCGKNLPFVREKYYFCSVYTHAVPTKSYIDKDGGTLQGRGWPNGRGWALLNVKASLTLCLLASLNLGNSIVCQWQCQKWLLRVWNNCIPGCAREGILYSLMHTYTEIRADTGVGRHSTRHTQGLFLRPKPETSGGGSPRFAFCSSKQI